MTTPLPPDQALLSLPDSPGVYVYRNKRKEIIYIGKAVNLKKRVKQYFQREDAVGEKTPKLVSEIFSIETIQTANEFDALLLEAKLIKEYQPKFNVISKDDKSPLYIVFQFEKELPSVFFGRKPKQFIQNAQIAYIGPFQSSAVARDLLRSLRKIVPFCTQKVKNGKHCFYTHLGLCNPCPSYISKLKDTTLRNSLIKKYRSNIFRLRDILTGKAVFVIKEMEKEMNDYAQKQEYEQAASLRNQLQALRTLLSTSYSPHMYTQSDSQLSELFDQEKTSLFTTLKPFFTQLNALKRIECYDISNIQGTNATASMVVMIDGRIDKKEYRKFKIQHISGPNDVAMMEQVITRRFLHAEWQFPDLLVIDGGKGQVTAAKQGLLQAMEKTQSEITDFSHIPIIGLAKREEEIVIPYKNNWKIIRLPFSSPGLKMIQRLRDEAHRFAKTYHIVLRNKHAITAV